MLNLRSSPADFFPAEDGRQVDQPFVFVAASFTPLQSPFFFLIRSGHPYHRNSTCTDFWDARTPQAGSELGYEIL